ncbi:type 1 glutamine amidotransferase [Tropicibacter naphthalenivorans]|uniref:GMP synthase [glutamine-hydrolyzing] n=1 Tax=Tropicibacter naphthalenivorans TaxID=441103 RepID=A0A0P1GQH9_9RHOB|nr:type 1 glutamine amidotransferase [Tropicibacter naphthalenivorans]CUH76384.1 GMP synthase [glutamine-hydrolyzing] [Tropicibacter naphthalenivorans]SMC66346.1 GMP synthase-Glutamine amidotransferase [Tropicibacter naphthalenivorans]
MKIGILQTGLVPPDLVPQSGEYPDMFQRLLADQGFEFQTFSVVNGDFPASVDDADGWLITGSRHGVYEEHPWMAPLEQLIRDIYAADKPLIGVCFGHQIIAQALGGKVEKFDGGWSVGPKDYQFADGVKTLHAFHQDQVITPPEGAQTVAHNDFCAHAALLYPGKAYTVQPHPEFQDGFMRDLLELRGKGVVPDDRLQAATTRTGTPLDSAEIAQQFARFFRERSI